MQKGREGKRRKNKQTKNNNNDDKDNDMTHKHHFWHLLWAHVGHQKTIITHLKDKVVANPSYSLFLVATTFIATYIQWNELKITKDASKETTRLTWDQNFIKIASKGVIPWSNILWCLCETRLISNQWSNWKEYLRFSSAML